MENIKIKKDGAEKKEQKMENGMTVRQMAKRLNAILEENKSRGWDERNDLPVLVEIKRNGKNSSRYLRSHFYTKVDFACGSKMGLDDNSYGTTITMNEDSFHKWNNKKGAKNEI